MGYELLVESDFSLEVIVVHVVFELFLAEDDLVFEQVFPDVLGGNALFASGDAEWEERYTSKVSRGEKLEWRKRASLMHWTMF